MSRLTDSIRDPWRAARMGASLKKTWVAFNGVFYGWLFYLVMSYAAHLVSGHGPAQVWVTWHFFPGAPPTGTWSIPYLIWLSGVVGGSLMLLVGAAGVAKLTYRELKGDDFYGASDAWRFAVEHGPSTMGTPLLLTLLAAAGLAAAGAAGLLVRIPVAGPVLFGLLLVPLILVSLGVLYLVVGALLSLLLAPAVVGCSGEDAVEGAIQCLGVLWTHPWRLACYLAATALSTGIGTWVAAAATATATAAGGAVLMWVAGPDTELLAATAIAYVPLWGAAGPVMPLLVPGLLRRAYTFLMFSISGGTFWTSAGGLLAGLALLVVTGGVVAYALASLYAGVTASYLSLRRRKDGEDLLTWADEIDELEEGAVPPPAA